MFTREKSQSKFEQDKFKTKFFRRISRRAVKADRAATKHRECMSHPIFLSLSVASLYILPSSREVEKEYVANDEARVFVTLFFRIGRASRII